jgi:hypothetical protein
MVHEPDPEELDSDLLWIADRLAGRACPRCETARQRSEHREPGPALWFDTDVAEWVLRIPSESDGSRVVGLGISWFDASESLVYRTACGLLA